jgi:uncharacterized protein YkwD
MNESASFALRSLVTFAAICIASIGWWGAEAAGAVVPSEERAIEVELIARINALRDDKGLRALAEDRPDLTAMARSWSEAMADDGGISHRTDLTTAAPADWVRIGENVGVGGSARALHDAFVRSRLHYKNLVDPGFDSVAVGVVVRGGQIWVTENFLRAAPAGTSLEPVASAKVSAPPGGLGHRTCVTPACRRGAFAGARLIAFVRV